MRKRRVIERLRELYPGVWRYDVSDYSWVHEDGWRVRASSVLSPRYDGDDDSFRTQYRRSDTGEIVFGLSDILSRISR